MGDKSTLSITRETAEQVKNIRRQLSYSLDRDLTIDETISELCKERQERFNAERSVESTQVVPTPPVEPSQELPEPTPELDEVSETEVAEPIMEILPDKKKGKKPKASTLDI